jgi:hypothetical protein
MSGFLKFAWLTLYYSDNQCFKSTIDSLEIVEIPGSLGLKKLYNPELTKNKRKTNLQIFDSTPQTFKEFNDEDFNCTKVLGSKEILGSTGQGRHKILINASPILRYHYLFCPFLEEKLIQRVDRELLSEAHKFFRDFSAGDSSLTVTFSSLGASCSVNHLHFQVFFEDFPILRAKFIETLVPGVSVTTEWPIVSVKFQEFEIFAKFVTKLLELDIPHNLLIRASEFVVIPRKSTRPVWKGLKPAVVELSGIVICTTEEEFLELNEDILRETFRVLSYERQQIIEIINTL